MLLRFTFENGSVEGDVCPTCAVDFSLNDVRGAVMELSEESWKEARGQGRPVVSTWKRHHPRRLLEWLESQPAGDGDTVQPTTEEWRCWPDLARCAVASARFLCAHCCHCRQAYPPKQVGRAWHEVFRGPLDAWGGWHHFCPRGHMLFRVTRWVS